jgi:DNA helicase-4
VKQSALAIALLPLFIKAWQQQCSEKKAQAKGWRQWLEEELEDYFRYG